MSTKMSVEDLSNSRFKKIYIGIYQTCIVIGIWVQIPDYIPDYMYSKGTDSFLSTSQCNPGYIQVPFRLLGAVTLNLCKQNIVVQKYFINIKKK